MTNEIPLPIRFRPHHFMCTLAFQGLGYSLPFIKNYQNIVKILKEDPYSLLQVTLNLDEICHYCPHQLPNKLCDNQQLINKLDKAHQEILEIKEHQIISWLEAKKRLKAKMSLENFHSACQGCVWKASGICETRLKELHATTIIA